MVLNKLKKKDGKWVTEVRSNTFQELDEGLQELLNELQSKGVI